MENGAAPKVRLVRCPKCRLVLPEVADVPVYRCGGCDTILVAKNRKTIVKSSSVLQETEAAQANKSFHVSERGESSSSTPQEVLPSPLEHNLSQEHGWDKNISSDSHIEKHGENLSTEGQHHNQHKEDHTTSYGVCDMHDLKTSNEGKENGSQQLLQSDPTEYCNIQNPGISIKGSLYSDFHHENEEILLQEANLEAEAEDKTLQLEGVTSEVETTDKSDSNIRGLSIDSPPLTREITLIDTASAAAKDVILSDNLAYSPDEQNEHHGFDSIRSTDTFETAGFVSPSSEFSGPLEYLSKSTTTKSSHAYDGSISSYDGMDDHFPDQQIHTPNNNSKAVNYLAPEETHRRGKLPGKSMMNGNSGMINHATNHSSDLSYKKHYDSAKYSKWHRDEVLDPVMHHHAYTNWQRLERDECSSRVPLSQRASLHGYESSGPSCELHDDFPFGPSFYPHEKADYAEQENMELLRMMYELQDQKHFPMYYHLNGKPNGRNSADIPWRQKHFHMYYHQEAAKEENFYPRYRGIHGQRSSWSQHSRFSRVPFLGGAIDTRHHIENSCFCCNPQDWQRSEQLASTIFRHNWGGHSGHSCYNSYSSCPSSPQRYLESDFSIKSDEHRYKDHELKMYMREKHHSVRRHLRPTAGGAPFITCYHCFRALQLPADFLLFKRKLHQLRCGACLKVLKFSLQKGSHIVPYELVAVEPPPSEVEDTGGEVVTVSSRSASGNHVYLLADPTSCSDDYDHSFCKSCSTDGDPVSHVKFHELKANADVRNASNSSLNIMELRKEVVLKQSHNKHKNSAETCHSSGGSSRVSAGIEDLPPRTGGSPLHQLMGYSSPSQVLRGFETSISYKSS